MKLGRWGAPAALALLLVTDSASSRAEQRSWAVTLPECAATGGCIDPSCQEPGRYLATEELVWDSANGGRLWQRASGPQGNFATAEAYCASLIVQGLGGWRLPTNQEIGTIVLRPSGLGGRRDACVPALDQAAFTFPDPTGPLWFWTSTRQGPRPIVYLRDFSDGRSPRTFEDDQEPWVRCVHDPLF